MTDADVRDRVSAIFALEDDHEAAHKAEDELYVDVLDFIADEAPEKFARLARLALGTKDCPFYRWHS